jgi:hypothetical protein
LERKEIRNGAEIKTIHKRKDEIFDKNKIGK